MGRKKPEPDENEAAARIVREAARAEDEPPESVAAAWVDWSRRIQGLDERTRTLLRAALDAGAAAANAGRVKGAKAGGNARAANLTPRQRKAIARKAARARWSGS